MHDTTYDDVLRSPRCVLSHREDRMNDWALPKARGEATLVEVDRPDLRPRDHLRVARASARAKSRGRCSGWECPSRRAVSRSMTKRPKPTIRERSPAFPC